MAKITKPSLLVIGGTGFIGYHLLLEAKKRKWKVASISLNKPKKYRFVKGASYIKVDITNLQEVKKKLNKSYDYVVNSGGYGDHSNFEMPNYDVSQYKNQLSAILYLQIPKCGGELTIFDKIWCKEDECMRHPEFGYQSNIVHGVTKSNITPVAGNMIILNPKFYHRIESVHGSQNRVSIGFFFAEFSKNNLCAWA